MAERGERHLQRSESSGPWSRKKLTSSSEHVKSLECLQDLCGLYNPEVKKPLLPFVRNTDADIDGSWKKFSFSELVKGLLRDLFKEWGRTLQARDFDAIEDWISCTKTYYIVRQIVPLLVDGLNELLTTSEFIAGQINKDLDEIETLGDGEIDSKDITEELEGERALFMPLNFLGCYLMRHNPSHPSLFDRRSSKAKRRHACYVESSAIVHDFFAELAVRRRLEVRQALWRTEGGMALMEVWKNCCPREKDELRIHHIEENISTFKKYLGLKESTTAEDILHLLEGNSQNGRVSFEQFELAVGNLLLSLDAMSAVKSMVHPSLKGKRKVSEWVRGKAIKKLEQRLEEFDIDPQEWFNEYADSKTKMMVQNDVKLCTRSIAISLNIDMDTVNLSTEVKKVTKEPIVGYDGFVRLVAELVRIAQKKNEAEFERKAKTLYEAKLAESIKSVQNYLREIDRLDSKVTKLKNAVTAFKSSANCIKNANAELDYTIEIPEGATREYFDQEVATVEKRLEILALQNVQIKEHIEQARRLTLAGGSVQGERESDIQGLITISKADLVKAQKDVDTVEKILEEIQTLFEERERAITAFKRDEEAKRKQEETEKREEQERTLKLMQEEKIRMEAMEREREKEAAYLAALQDQLEEEEVRENVQERGLGLLEKDPSRLKQKKKKRSDSHGVSKGGISGLAKSGNAKELRETLIGLSSDFRVELTNEKDKNGSTPLMHVSWTGNLECAKILVEFGANLLTTNVRLNTALHFAFERGHLEFAQFLLKHGAAPALKMKNSLGKTPIDLNPFMRHQLGL